MLSIKDRYNNDAQIRALVDYLTQAIDKLQFTPTEIREAAMLAAIHYEEHKCHCNFQRQPHDQD